MATYEKSLAVCSLFLMSQYIIQKHFEIKGENIIACLGYILFATFCVRRFKVLK